MDSFEKLYNKALRFLSFRPRSEKEIRDYLQKKNSDPQTAQKIIDKLKEYNFINDKEFARLWFESRIKLKPRAIRVIKLELKQKGIEDELIDEIFDNTKTDDKELALVLAEKRFKRYAKEEPQKAKEKMYRFLISKGFNYDTIKDVVDHVLGK